MLVMMLSDQALEIVRNFLEGVGAELRRKLLWEYEPGVGIRYGAMLQSLLKRRFGELDETDLAREIETFERDISKYEQQSSDLISDAIQHGIVCGGMAHQGMKQHTDLSSSRLPTCTALRDEIISYSSARRTWTDPNAMQVDAVHVNVNQERQVDGNGSRSDKGKSSKGGKGMSKKGGTGKERGETAVTKFDGECRYCLKRGHKKSDCRKMKSDIAAGKCDKSGKPIEVNALSAAGATQPSQQARCAPSMASTIPLQQMVPVYFLCPDGSQTSQPTETWYINMIVPAQKTLMVASLDGAQYALLDSGSGLTSCPNLQTRLRRKNATLGMDDTLEVPLTRGSEGSDARGSRYPVAHSVETLIAQRREQHLTWCCGVMRLVDYSSQLRRKGKPEERASQLVQIRQRRLRTSSRTRVSATFAATACELELRTIHITDNHTKSQSSRSSWLPTALCRCSWQ